MAMVIYECIGVKFGTSVSKKTGEAYPTKTIYGSYEDAQTEGIASESFWTKDMAGWSPKLGEKFLVSYNKFGGLDYFLPAQV